MRISIRMKLFTLIITTVIATVLVFFLAISTIIERLTVRDYSTRIKTYFGIMADTYQPGSNAREFLRTHEKGLRGFISIFDENLKILASSSPELSNYETLPEFHTTEVKEYMKLPVGKMKLNIVSNPIMNSRMMIGGGRLTEHIMVQIEKPIDVINDAITLSMKAMAFSLPVVVTIGFAMAYMFAYIFTKPIIAIKKKALNIAALDFSNSIRIKNQDELGDLAGTINVISNKLKITIENLNQTNTRLEQISETDSLTGLANRLKVDKVLADEVYRTRNRGKIFSLILTDIDHFKRVNDMCGHLIGDDVLKDFASILQKHSRQTDTVARWGGEEFLILLPDTPFQAAMQVAEKLRSAVEGHHFGKAGRLTASFGVCQYKSDYTTEDIFHCLDEALYAAKRTGRNKIENAMAFLN